MIMEKVSEFTAVSELHIGSDDKTRQVDVIQFKLFQLHVKSMLWKLRKFIEFSQAYCIQANEVA